MAESKAICPFCEEGELHARVVKHRTEIGEYKVDDGSARARVCTKCERPVMPIKQVEALELRAAKFVLLKQKVTGPAMRDIRRILGLTQVALAKLLGVAQETVCRIEKGQDEVDTVYRLALVALRDRAERGESLDGAASIADDIQLAG